MIKIAISGKANAGKNTLATMLVKHLGLQESEAKIVGLADPMKNMILQMIPSANPECLFGPSALRSEIISKDLIDSEDRYLTYRQVLLDLGKFGRNYNPNIWLHALVQDAKRSTDKKAYLISDVRFCNEFDYFKMAKFFMIRIRRPSNSMGSDISETAQDALQDSQFHAVIENDDGLTQLDSKAQEIARSIPL